MFEKKPVQNTLTLDEVAAKVLKLVQPSNNDAVLMRALDILSKTNDHLLAALQRRDDRLCQIHGIGADGIANMKNAEMIAEVDKESATQSRRTVSAPRIRAESPLDIDLNSLNNSMPQADPDSDF
jgi:hypothetical protein